MNLLRNLIPALLLVWCNSVLGQVVQLYVGFPPGGSVDVVARALGGELTPILGKPVVIINKVGDAGAAAIREFGSARPDGSQLLLLSSLNARPPLDVAGLIPVATVVGPTSNWYWSGVFAPPGTPAGTVANLERAILAALNSPGFATNIARLGGGQLAFAPTPAGGAQFARLIAQASSGGSAPAVSSSPAAASSAHAGPSRENYVPPVARSGASVVGTAPVYAAIAADSAPTQTASSGPIVAIAMGVVDPSIQSTKAEYAACRSAV